MTNENRYYKTPFAESGNKTEIPDVSVGGVVGYDSGYGPDYELPQGSVNRKRIERDLYNGMFNGVTKNLKQWQENIYPTWIEDDGTGSAFAYPEGMIVSLSNVNYISLEDNNQEEPGTGDKWSEYVAPVPSEFDSVANMKLASPKAGTELRTSAFYLNTFGGDAFYLVKTAAQASTDGDIVDEFTNHTLANGNIAILQQDGIVDFRAVGGKPYDVATKLDNSAALLAADAQGFTIKIVGGFFFSAPVDLGLASTNVRTQIIGVENTNFDNVDRSVLLFEATGGITVHAGCKIHDLEIRNIDNLSKVGTGLTAHNIHGSSIKNVTVSFFDRSAYFFIWTSTVELLYSYECNEGLTLYGECTSTTFKSCYTLGGSVGYDVGEDVTYCTFLNCAVDNCDVPYRFRGGNNINLDNCGCEINHADIDGVFEFTGVEASTVTISGGRYLVGDKSAFTTKSIAYTVVGAANTFGNIVFSRMSTNSFSNPTEGFVGGKVRVVFGDTCMLSDALNLHVKDGEFGSIMMDGRSSGALRRFAKTTPKIGSSQDSADAIPHMLSIVIEEVIDFDQAIADGDSVFIKFFGVEATSNLQMKVEAFPLTDTGTGSPYSYHEFAGWAWGSFGFRGQNITGTLFDYGGADGNGFQNFYMSRTALRGKAFVRVTATGWSDVNYRDVLCKLLVEPDDA